MKSQTLNLQVPNIMDFNTLFGTVSDTMTEQMPSDPTLQKQQLFERAIADEFLQRYSQRFPTYKALIIFERSTPKTQKNRLWGSVGGRCGLTQNQAYKYYLNTWSKIYLNSYSDQVRYNALTQVTQYIIKNYTSQLDDAAVKQLVSTSLEAITEQLQLQSQQYFDCHYETLYHAMYSKATYAIKQLKQNTPAQKIYATIDRPQNSQNIDFGTLAMQEIPELKSTLSKIIIESSKVQSKKNKSLSQTLSSIPKKEQSSHFVQDEKQIFVETESFKLYNGDMIQFNTGSNFQQLPANVGKDQTQSFQWMSGSVPKAQATVVNQMSDNKLFQMSNSGNMYSMTQEFGSFK